MCKDIEKISKIKRNELDEIDYFESLIKTAHDIQMLEISEIEDIQTQLLELLKIKMEKYNLLESTSIEIEKAKTIMESNMYTIGIYLKTFTPDDALEKLKKERIVSMYEAGRKIINKKVAISKILYKEVLKSTLQIANETYLDTIIKGIKGFFKIYEPNYNAKDKKITADYPLYDSLIGKLEGIEFIEEYLKSLKIENEYLSKYDTFKINELLYNYREDYTSLIENIFKIVLRQNIGQILAGEEVDTPNISHDGVSKIFLELNNMTKNEIYDKIKEANCRLEIKSKEAKEYIEKGLEELQFEIYNSYKLNNLDKVFICF